MRLEPDGTLRWAETIICSSQITIASLEPTSDGGFLLAGSFRASSGSSTSAWAARFAPDGQFLWQKQFAGFRVFFNSAASTADGGWALLGGYSAQAFDCEILALKLDSTGNLVWVMGRGSQVENTGGWGSRIRQAADGTLVATGTASPCYQIPGGPPWAMKLNAQGGVLWWKLIENMGIGNSTDVAPTSDGGLAVSGFGRPDMSSAAVAWLVRMSATGVPLWEQAFSNDDTECMFISMKDLSDGFLMLGGKRSRTGTLQRAWLAQTDGLGALVWEHTYDLGTMIVRGSLDTKPTGGCSPGLGCPA